MEDDCECECSVSLLIGKQMKNTRQRRSWNIADDGILLFFLLSDMNKTRNQQNIICAGVDGGRFSAHWWSGNRSERSKAMAQKNVDEFVKFINFDLFSFPSHLIFYVEGKTVERRKSKTKFRQPAEHINININGPARWKWMSAVNFMELSSGPERNSSRSIFIIHLAVIPSKNHSSVAFAAQHKTP